MGKFVEKVKEICEQNNKVAIFVDMDGTIVEYEVFDQNEVKQKMDDNYNKALPLYYVIERLEEINRISNLDIYILTLSKTTKLVEEKKKWLERYTPFINKENWIIINKEKNEYNKENRSEIKAKTIENISKGKYDKTIFLDDEQKLLRVAKDRGIEVFHISSVLA